MICSVITRDRNKSLIDQSEMTLRRAGRYIPTCGRHVDADEAMRGNLDDSSMTRATHRPTAVISPRSTSQRPGDS